MNYLKNTVLPVLISTIWISISEFVRNEYILKSYWIDHFKSLGLEFPSGPVNGVIWGLWSLLFAISIFIISRKFNFIQTAMLAWFVGFILMWVVIGNLGMLPSGILYFAVPLSLLEAFIASLIIIKLAAISK